MGYCCCLSVYRPIFLMRIRHSAGISSTSSSLSLSLLNADATVSFLVVVAGAGVLNFSWTGYNRNNIAYININISTFSIRIVHTFAIEPGFPMDKAILLILGGGGAGNFMSPSLESSVNQQSKLATNSCTNIFIYCVIPDWLYRRRWSSLPFECVPRLPPYRSVRSLRWSCRLLELLCCLLYAASRSSDDDVDDGDRDRLRSLCLGWLYDEPGRWRIIIKLTIVEFNQMTRRSMQKKCIQVVIRLEFWAFSSTLN